MEGTFINVLCKQALNLSEILEPNIALKISEDKLIISIFSLEQKLEEHKTNYQLKLFKINLCGLFWVYLTELQQPIKA